MYQVKVDPHTHTIFSGHAFSTIGENVAEGKKAGLEAVGLADHFGPTFTGDKPSWGSMMNMPALPRVIDGVTVLGSVEIDIVDFEGRIAYWDLPLPFRRPGDPEDMCFNYPLLATRDYAIASVHRFPDCDNHTVALTTQMYCNVLRNPYIHVIGHPARPGMKFDIDEVCKTAKEQGKMLEINDHSFDSPTHITDECRRVALRCAELGTQIVVSSDAHSAWFVGQFQRALAMLEDIHFPEELIANRTLASFQEALSHCKK